MAVWQRSGVKPDYLASGPAMPCGCGQLWADFLELHSSRAYDMNGPSRIGFREMGDWQAFYGAELAAWEVAAIFRADDAFMASRAK